MSIILIFACITWQAIDFYGLWVTEINYSNCHRAVFDGGAVASDSCKAVLFSTLLYVVKLVRCLNKKPLEMEICENQLRSSIILCNICFTVLFNTEQFDKFHSKGIESCTC